MGLLVLPFDEVFSGFGNSERVGPGGGQGCGSECVVLPYRRSADLYCVHERSQPGPSPMD
jgi:hypothetical protein